MNFTNLMGVFLLVSSTALAAPVVGDSAYYIGQLSGENFERTVTVTAAVPGNDVVSTHETVIVAGQTYEQDETYDSSKDSFYTQAANDLSFCQTIASANQGTGVVEPFILAGMNNSTIPSCHLSLGEGIEFYLADVPFGTAQLVRPDQITMVLVSYVKH